MDGKIKMAYDSKGGRTFPHIYAITEIEITEVLCQLNLPVKLWGENNDITRSKRMKDNNDNAIENNIKSIKDSQRKIHNSGNNNIINVNKDEFVKQLLLKERNGD